MTIQNLTKLNLQTTSKWEKQKEAQFLEFRNDKTLVTTIPSKSITDDRAVYTDMPNEIPPRISVASKSNPYESSRHIYRIKGNQLILVTYIDSKAGFPGNVDFDSPGEAYSADKLERR